MSQRQEFGIDKNFGFLQVVIHQVDVQEAEMHLFSVDCHCILVAILAALFASSNRALFGKCITVCFYMPLSLYGMHPITRCL